MFEHVADDVEVHALIAVHENVAEARGSAKRAFEIGANPPRVGEQAKEVMVGDRLTQAGTS